MLEYQLIGQGFDSHEQAELDGAAKSGKANDQIVPSKEPVGVGINI
jgi:hypothetical protein